MVEKDTKDSVNPFVTPEIQEAIDNSFACAYEHLVMAGLKGEIKLDEEKTYTLSELQDIFIAAQQSAGLTLPEPKPLTLMYSFEMKQASKGQRYYDIKVMNIQPDEIESALATYDRLDEELQRRALLGE